MQVDIAKTIDLCWAVPMCSVESARKPIHSCRCCHALEQNIYLQKQPAIKGHTALASCQMWMYDCLNVWLDRGEKLSQLTLVKFRQRGDGNVANK